jgi:hypothetical protein
MIEEERESDREGSEAHVPPTTNNEATGLRSCGRCSAPNCFDDAVTEVEGVRLCRWHFKNRVGVSS